MAVLSVSWVLLLLCAVVLGHDETPGDLEELRQEIHQLRNITQEQAKELSALREQVEAAESHRVAFTASLGSDGIVSTKNVKKTLIYKDVLSNVGKAYDPETGVFTVPVRGVYYVRYTATAPTDAPLGVALYRNQQVQLTVQEPPAGPGSDTASNGAALLLEAGDQIYVQLWPNTQLWDNAHRHTTFTAFLLFTV